MTGKERIMHLIQRMKPDRMPCFGANSTVTYDEMKEVEAFWPEGHEKGEAMAKQAMASYTIIGFDAVRVPFSQIIEAEALGCKVKSGGALGIPGIDAPPPYRLDEIPLFPDDFLNRGRIPELLKAVRILKKTLGDQVAIIGGMIGPFTLAGYLLETTVLLKASMKFPKKILPFLEVAEKAGTALAKALIQEGVDLIACEDMAASPELSNPQTYKEYVLDFHKRQFEAISVPKILHICGNVDSIVEWMGMAGAEILSLEPKTDLKLARERCGSHIILMGGVDTAQTLFMKDAEAVKKVCQESIVQGIQILAPGCSVAPGTPMQNLKAMVEVAKSHS